MYKFLILFILLLPFSLALQITEVEMNPLGSDSGKEWIEFYSEMEVNLSNYKIINNDQGELSLSGNNSGYFILILNSQWLDNKDERIYLYKENELIQETTILEDSKNNDLTFQLCGEEWFFQEKTPKQENSCPESEPDPEPIPPENLSSPLPEIPTPEIKISEPNKNISKPKTIFPPKEEKKQETIYLNTQTIKTPENSSKQQDRKPIIFFIGFCMVLSILYFVQSKGKNKNEFR
ncbi:hypothetical protein HOD29_00470 [archaeon]|jgi:hypothetical protein|nr:hypothetical protein [archaeon]